MPCPLGTVREAHLHEPRRSPELPLATGCVPWGRSLLGLGPGSPSVLRGAGLETLGSSGGQWSGRPHPGPPPGRTPDPQPSATSPDLPSALWVGFLLINDGLFKE